MSISRSRLTFLARQIVPDLIKTLWNLRSAFGELIGTITESVSWCKGEWMGFSVAVHLFPVIKRWLQKFTPLLPEIGESKGRVSVIGGKFWQGVLCVLRVIIRVFHMRLCSTDHSIDRYGVVLVSSPRIWGSGVILNKKLGLVVTCSHVVSYVSIVIGVVGRGLATKSRRQNKVLRESFTQSIIA